MQTNTSWLFEELLRRLFREQARGWNLGLHTYLSPLYQIHWPSLLLRALAYIELSSVWSVCNLSAYLKGLAETDTGTSYNHHPQHSPRERNTLLAFGIKTKTWVLVDSGSWWWTGRPGVLRFMGSQRVRHDWATELTGLIAYVALPPP